MANLLRRLAGRDLEQRYSIDQWISEYLIPASNQFGGTGLTQTLMGKRMGEISASLPGFAAALRGCPPAFAAQMVRALVLSQARFTFRNRPSTSTPRRLWSSNALAPLETPWPNATTGELISRMEWHAGLAGNAFVTNRTKGRLRVLRPDWTAILYGSQREPEDPGHALDGELIGYVYQNGGINSGSKYRPETLLPMEVAHWSPLPDPENAGIGMSWITPALREIQADRGYTEHKIAFLSNGATPNMVVKGIPATSKKQFDEVVDMMEENHRGIGNAYRTLYLATGADVSVVGSDLNQMDFKATQGAGETRISVLSRVPAAFLGISEGLAGSALNAGNYSSARRTFSDSWVYPTLQDMAAALAPLVKVPADSELWFDTVDMTMLREDAKDAAEIEQIKQTTIVGYVKEGFTPESAVAAVRGQDISLLKHTGLVSVQLQPPGAIQAPTTNGKTPAALPAAK